MTKKVLVVDDQYHNRAAKARSLKLIGYNVDEAVDGMSALKRFIADNYHVILMDCDMPFMTGPECAQKIREYEIGTEFRTFIIGVSSSLNKNIQDKCIQAGMDACIEDASNSEELQKIVNELASAS